MWKNKSYYTALLSLYLFCSYKNDLRHSHFRHIMESLDITTAFWCIMGVLSKIPLSQFQCLVYKQRAYKLNTSCLLDVYVPFPNTWLFYDSLRDVIVAVSKMYDSSPDGDHHMLVTGLAERLKACQDTCDDNTTADIDTMIASLHL